MSDRIISFPNGVSKNFGVRAGLLSDTTLTDNGFTVDFYVPNGHSFQFSRENVSTDKFTIAAAAYGVEQRVKSATNMKPEERTADKIAEQVLKVLTSLKEEGWTAARQAGTGTSKPSTYEKAFLAVEGNTQDMWDALSAPEKRNVRKDPEVNAAYLEIQTKIAKEEAAKAKQAKADAIELDEAA